MSQLQAYYDSLGAPFQVLVVNIYESMAITKWIQSTYNIYPPVLNNQSGSVYAIYNQNGYIPLNHIICGDDNQTVYYWGNSMTLSQMKWQINMALLASVEETPAITEQTTLKTPTISRNRINIEYSLKKTSAIKLTVYDVSGKVTNRLSEGVKNSGSYFTAWYPKKNGIYFIKLITENKVITNKVVILK